MLLPDAPLPIGTRGSPLALAQARGVQAALVAAHGLPEAAFPIVVMVTSGDRIRDRALAEAGGKGLFTKEIDEAQLSGAVRLSVHSAKDLPTALAGDLVVAATPEREDPRDALILGAGACDGPPSVLALRAGARIGTASLRRAALLRRSRPDVSVGLLRGNVGTRLARVAAGDFDATVLALAGLKRLGLEARADALLPLDAFPPAPGQGAVAVLARAGDAAALAAAGAINHADTLTALAAERAFLAALDGSCRTPVAALATLDGARLRLAGLALRPDGAEAVAEALTGEAADAAAIGRFVGEAVRDRLPPGFFQVGAAEGDQVAGPGGGAARGGAG